MAVNRTIVHPVTGEHLDDALVIHFAGLTKHTIYIYIYVFIYDVALQLI